MKWTRLISPRALVVGVSLVVGAAVLHSAPRDQPSSDAAREGRHETGRTRARRHAPRALDTWPATAAVEDAFVVTGASVDAQSSSTGLDTSIAADGTVRMRAGGRIDVRMRLTHAGRGGEGVHAPEVTRVEAGRAILERGAMREWYVQSAQGLEQGFDLFERPLGAGAVVLRLEIDGASPKARGSNAILVGADGDALLAYRELVVTDSAGRDLPASIRVHEDALALVFDDELAEYPVRVDPFVSPMYATLTAAVADLAAGAECGHAVALRNGLATVGCPSSMGPALQDGAGSVLLFEEMQSGGNVSYAYLTKLHASTPVSGARFGASLDFDGTRLVVGAPAEGLSVTSAVGRAYVFSRQGTGNTFVEIASLGPSDPAEALRFGASVALSGNTVLVGAPGGSPGLLAVDTGTVYLFDLALAAPHFVVEFGAPSAVSGDDFGAAVAISGGNILVGAPLHDVDGISDAGAIFGFRPGTGGSPIFVVEVPNPAPVTNAGFGAAVDLDAMTGVVGCPRCSTARGANTGSANVYAVDTAGAVQRTTLFAPDLVSGDHFGRSVAIDGDVIVVGAPGVQVAANAARVGAAYAYVASGSGYLLGSKLVPSDAVSGDGIGFSVAIDRVNDRVVLGAPGDVPPASLLKAGSARVFGLPEYLFLEVTVGGSGTGSVTTLPEGIDCPGDCVEVFAGGTSVVLTATPDSGSYVASVSGDCSASPCQLVIDGDSTVDVVFELQAADGTSCVDSIECTSGFCIDGVCCESSCGDGQDDCQACSVAASGATDGACTPLVAAVASVTVCHPSTGLCDPAETCAADSPDCPADVLAPSGTTCRAGADEVCDPSEVCDGESPECPADVIAEANTPCDNGLFCDGVEACDGAGACVSHSAPQCADDGNPCTADLCVDRVGCISVARPGCVVVDGGAVFPDAGLDLDASVDGSMDGSVGDGTVVPQTSFQGEGGCACAVAGRRATGPRRLVFLLGFVVFGFAAVRSRRRNGADGRRGPTGTDSR